MRTYKCTVVTLDTCIRIPYRNHNGCTTFLICGSTSLKLTIRVTCECRYWKAVTIHLRNWLKKVIYHLNNFRTSGLLFRRSICFRIFPRFRYFYFMNCVNTTIDCFVVHFYDSITFFGVRFLSCFFHELNRIINWHYISKFEECRLQNCVSTFTHTNFNCFINRVDCVKLNVVVCNIFLSFSVQVMSEFFVRPLAVNHEYTARFYILSHLHTLCYISRVMTCYEVSLVDVVRTLNRIITKTKMGNCYTTCFL